MCPQLYLEHWSDGEVCSDRAVGEVQVLMPYTCGYEHAFSFADLDVRIGRIIRTLLLRRGYSNAELALENIDDLIPLMGLEPVSYTHLTLPTSDLV